MDNTILVTGRTDGDPLNRGWLGYHDQGTEYLGGKILYFIVSISAMRSKSFRLSETMKHSVRLNLLAAMLEYLERP